MLTYFCVLFPDVFLLHHPIWAPLSAQPLRLDPLLLFFPFHISHGLPHFSHFFSVPVFLKSQPAHTQQQSRALFLHRWRQPALSQQRSRGGDGADLKATERKSHHVGAEIWAHEHIHAQLKGSLGHQNGLELCQWRTAVSHYQFSEPAP